MLFNFKSEYSIGRTTVYKRSKGNSSKLERKQIKKTTSKSEFKVTISYLYFAALVCVLSIFSINK